MVSLAVAAVLFQEMRMGTAHPQTVTPGHMGGLNTAGGRPMSNMYNHSTGGQTFSNNAPMRPSPRILGSSDLTNLSAAEVYRQQHEVSASVCIPNTLLIWDSAMVTIMIAPVTILIPSICLLTIHLFCNMVALDRSLPLFLS